MRSGFAITAAGLAIGLGFATQAWAADTGGPSTPVCPRGQIYDTRTSKCVPIRNSNLDDEQLYEQGRQLAKVEERYEDAIAVLSQVRRQDDPRVWNFLGYSHRKLGDVDRGVAYYYRALMLKSDYSLVREYLGEAYVQKGRLDLAKEQLSEIVKECGGTACEPYKDLAEEIEAAEKKAKG